MKKSLFIALLFGLSSPLWARTGTGLLPRGVGLYQLGYRHFTEMDQKFDDRGEVVPLGENFDREFSGERIISGRQGKELKKLGTVLKEFEGGSTEPGTLAGDLYLGHLQGDVTAQVDTQILGLGFGLFDKLTVFLGVPYIKAKVHTRLTVSGTNNAQATLDKLGEAAFTDLREGLEEAAQMSAFTIKSKFEELGYKPVDNWSHAGIGDLRIGGKSGIETFLSKSTSVISTVTGRIEIPTGYTEKPEYLTDINFGRGFYSLNLSSEQILDFGSAYLGSDVTYAYNFNTKLDKRVPEGIETTMGIERTTKVNVNPGDDGEFGLFMGGGWKWLTSRYRAAWSRHLNDKYSGSLEGNYTTLSEGSDNWKVYHEISASLDTSKAYRAGEFSFPFVITGKMQMPLQGRNTPDQRFFELTLASFFSTVKSPAPSSRSNYRPSTAK